MLDCIFCKIIGGEIPSEKIYEDDATVVFKDIHPKARVHLLIVPKVHIPTLMHLKEGEEYIVSQLFSAARKVSQSLGLEGFRLVMNVGEKGGQEIFHIHLHLMAE